MHRSGRAETRSGKSIRAPDSGRPYNNVMTIRTKILATIGPACESVETITQLVQAGCDAFRINFSHGDNAQREGFLQAVRHVEAELGNPLAVVADLCGPKIRTGPIVGGSVLLVDGQDLIIQREAVIGNAVRISTTLNELVDAAAAGQSILMDDGKLRLEVVQTRPPDEVLCRVAVGGILATGKGINLPDMDLALSAMTEKDRADAAWIAERDFDYVALSFVQRPQDVRDLRDLLAQHGSDARIIAKIEKPRALAQIDEIIGVADAIMVARGDLGVEMALPSVPIAQKRIAALCQSAGKCCIIATQMLESMTQAPSPTRAEVSDVANAVLDHADAVMLSGETAIGKYPVRTVAMMNDIVTNIQAYHDEQLDLRRRVGDTPAAMVSSLAAAIREIIAAEDIAAVAAFTISGTTARILAKSRLTCPIMALSPELDTVRQMCLYYGVESMQAALQEHTRDVLALAQKFAVDRRIARPGDKIVVVSGRPLGKPGTANTLVVHTIE